MGNNNINTHFFLKILIQIYRHTSTPGFMGCGKKSDIDRKLISLPQPHLS